MPRAVRFTRLAPWALLGALFFVMLLVSFDVMDQWISDSRFYLAWAYKYLGYSEADAARMTYEFMFGVDRLDSCDFCWPADYQYSFFHGENGAVVAPRMIYPLVSAPFVALFGPKGMLVVPALAYAVGMTAAAYLAKRLWGKWWGVATALALLLSAISMRFATMAMTDSLAMMFNVLGLLFLPLLRERRRWDVLWFLVILVLNLFTRQFAVTVAAGVALAWLVVAIRDRKARNAWLPFAAGSVVVTLAVIAVQNFYAARIYQGSELSLLARYQKMVLEKFGVDGFASIPKVAGWQARVDYHYVRELDMPLVVFIGAVAVALLWRYRSELTALTVGMALVTLAMGVLIVDQTYFRYFVPLMPLLVLCLLALLRDLFVTGTRPSRSTEGTGPWPVSARRVPAWIPVMGIYLVVALLVWRESLGHTDPLAALNIALGGIAVAGFLLAVSRRFSTAAGVAAAIAFSMSQILMTQTIDTVPHSLALVAVVACLALLPGSGFTMPYREVALGVSLFASALLTPRALALTVPLALVWLLVTVQQRQWRNDWLIPGLLAFGATAAGAIMATWTTASPSRSVFLFAKELSTDRILIAIGLIAAATLLTGLKQPLTWLALGGLAVAGALVVAFGHGAGAFQLAMPAALMAAAGAVTAYVRADLALESKTQQAT